MLTAVLIVLLLTGRAAPYTFTGGTENGSFTCHCEPDVQCNDETGACPGDWCNWGWFYSACQTGDVAKGGTADQTGDSSHVAERYSDRSCCKSRRTNGELSWTVDLGGTFTIINVGIFTTDDNVDKDTIRGVEVYLSAGRTPSDAELCGVQSGDIDSILLVSCSNKFGRYVTIRQPNVTIEEMMLCEVNAGGYEYYPCGFYDGDYKWGPACVENCHCEHQCDVITGVCDGNCTAGWKKNYKGICLEACTPGFWGVNCESDCHCEYNCDVITGVCDAGCTPGFGDVYCNPCRCLYASEVCDETTGHCESGCDDRYMGDGCDVVKPSLRDSTITFTEDKDVITATITDIVYQTELVSEYLVQYKLLHEDTFISINVSAMSGRRRRKVGGDGVVLQIPFFGQLINAQYTFRITPLISSPEYDGIIGLPSNVTLYNSGCLQYTGLPSCNHWCVCRDDPGTLCLLTCDYCHVCASEPEMPSEKKRKL